MVCTIGPASRSPKMIDKLVAAGMDVARLNFSHGTPEEHAATVKVLRAASAQHQKPIAILADLPGPKIRTGPLAGGLPVMLRPGRLFTISINQTAGSADGVSTTYRRLPREVRRGDRILLADGMIELRVRSTTSTHVVTEVVNGGQLREHQGINLPGVNLRVPALSAADHKDLRFAVEAGVNYIGVSFVRRPEGRARGPATPLRRTRQPNPDHRKTGKAGSHRKSR